MSLRCLSRFCVLLISLLSLSNLWSQPAQFNEDLTKWASAGLRNSVNRVLSDWGGVLEEPGEGAVVQNNTMVGFEGTAVKAAVDEKLTIRSYIFSSLEEAKQKYEEMMNTPVSGLPARCVIENRGGATLDTQTGKVYGYKVEARLCRNVVSWTRWIYDEFTSGNEASEAQDDLRAELIEEGLAVGAILESCSGRCLLQTNAGKQEHDDLPIELGPEEILTVEGDSVLVLVYSGVRIEIPVYDEGSIAISDPWSGILLDSGIRWLSSFQKKEYTNRHELYKILLGAKTEIRSIAANVWHDGTLFKVESGTVPSSGNQPLNASQTVVSVLEGTAIAHPNYDLSTEIRAEAGYRLTVTESDYTLEPMAAQEIAGLETEHQGLDRKPTLAVSLSGTGSGSVSSSPAGIDCGWHCDEAFEKGTTVTLTAIPDPGSTFAGWNGGCTGTDNCQIVLADNTHVVATFSAPEYTLRVDKTGPGEGLVTSSPSGIDCGPDCSAPFAEGTSVTLTATPASGSKFKGWGGDCGGAGTQCTVEMSSARNVTAEFGPACMYDLPVLKREHGAEAASDNFRVEATEGCNWTASTFNNWITLDSGGTGTGDGRVYYSVEAWSGCRSGSIQIEGDDGFRQTFTIIQSAGSGEDDWVGIGPAGVPIFALAVNPQDSKVVYAAGEGDQVHKTTDLGQSWSKLDAGLGSHMQVNDILIDPAQPATVYLATTNGGDGVYKSVNSGSSWKPASNGIGFKRVECLSFDQSGTLYAGTQFGLYTSDDGGANWSEPSTDLTDIAVWDVLATNSAVFAATQDGVRKSSDGGSTWVLVLEIPGSPDGARTLAVDPSDSRVVYAGTPDGGVYKTVNGGSTWSNLTSVFPSSRDVTSIAVLPGEVWAAATEVYRSLDGGTSWERADRGLAFRSATVLKADPKDSNRVFAGNFREGVFISANPSGPCLFSIDPTSAELGSEGGVGWIEVTAPAGAPWNATSNLDWAWFRFDTSGVGNGSTSYQAYENTSAEIRSGTLTVAGEVFTLTQAGVVLKEYALEVLKTGSGTGVVVSNPPGISCGSDCQGDFEEQATVTLTATPSTGSEFTGWGGSCQGTSLTCTLTMDGDKSVTANFDTSTTVVKPTLTVNKTGTGSGTVTSSPGGINCGSECSREFSEGTQVLLNAYPDPGSEFSGWSGACSGESTSCTVNLDTDKTVVAEFNDTGSEPSDPVLTVSTSGDGMGSVVSSPAGIHCGSNCSSSFARGTSLTLTAQPGTGSVFTGWSGACVGTHTNCQVTLTENQAVEAIFGVAQGGGGASSTWQEIGPSFTDINAVQIDPQNPSIVYAAAGSGSSALQSRLLRSASAGVTWEKLGPNIGPVAMAINPLNTLEIYTSAAYIHKTVDGGKTWQQLDPVGDVGTTVYSLAIDPKSPSIIYAGTGHPKDGGVYRSQNSGSTWAFVSNGLPTSSTDRVVRSILIHPEKPTFLLAATYGGTYRSTNSGGSWSQVHPIPSLSLAFDPSNPDKVYVGTNSISGAEGGVFRSSDFGSTWSAANSGYKTEDVDALAVDPSSGNVIAGTEDGKVLLSTNGGANWSPLGVDLPDNRQVSGLAVHPENPSLVYLGAVGTGGERGGLYAIGDIPVCTFTISPVAKRFDRSGGVGTVVVGSDPGCSWEVSASAPWIDLTSASLGSGNGEVRYLVTVNGSGSERIGTINIAGFTFTITQSSEVDCTYTIDPEMRNHGAGNENGSIAVTTSGSCEWNVVNQTAWITVTSGAEGIGNGTVSYSIPPNGSTSSRTGTLLVAGRTFTAVQQGTSASNQPPEADAGSDLTVAGGSLVTLSGAGTDPDGDPLTFSWVQTDDPQASLAVEIKDADKPVANFTAPEVDALAILNFQLTVTDGRGGTDSDSVTVQVLNQESNLMVAPISLDSSVMNSNKAAEQSTGVFEKTFVGVAIANPNETPNQAAISVLSAEGIEKKALNPESIPAQGQKAFVTSERVESGLGAVSLLARGISGPIQGFFMVGDNSLAKLDGVGGRMEPSTTLYFPIVRQNQQETTHFFLFNPGTVPAEVSLRLFDVDGVSLDTADVNLSSSGTLSASLAELFSVSALGEGYLVVESNSPVQGVEFVGQQSAFSALIGQTERKTERLMAPHFFVARAGGSTLRLLNLSTGKAVVTLRAFDNLSNQLGTAEIEVNPRQLVTRRLSDLLEIDLESLGQYDSISGYLDLEVVAASLGGFLVEPKLVGALTFTGNGDQYVSTLPLVSEGRKETLALHVAQSNLLKIFTGLAVLNPGESEAAVKVEIYSPTGEKSATKSLTIPAGQRVVDLLNGSAFFGPEFEQVGGHIKIISDEPVVVFALFGDFGLEYMAAIEGQAPITE